MQPPESTPSFIKRIFAVAGMLAAVSVVCFWLACTARLEPLGSGAVSMASAGGEAAFASGLAEQEEDGGDAALTAALPLAAPLPPEVLKASVDSLATSMGGVFAALPEPAARQAAMQKALDAMSFQPGAAVYYTAWENTTMLHSPLTPDTAGMDFQHAEDIDGARFMPLVAEQAEQGGFVSLVLPPARGAHAQPQHQQVYARSIPHSTWYVAAFMEAPMHGIPTAGREAGPHGGDSAPGSALRLGFLALALSFAGLSAVLVVHARVQSARHAPSPGLAPA